MTLDQDILRLAVHARQRMREERPSHEREMNFKLLTTLHEYAEMYRLPDAKFIGQMVRTYVVHPYQKSLFEEGSS